MTALTHTIFNLLTDAPSGQLPFAKVMELALYHPEHGYYGPGPRRIGRGGDFYTAVSVGPLYGQLLATLAEQIWAEMGSPTDFILIEQAAHDGQLAEDVLRATSADFSPVYVIVEPNPAYRAAQQARLAPWEERVRWVASLADLPPQSGFFLANELPDAMPVHLVRWTGGRWVELYVQRGDGERLEFTEGPLSCPRLVEETTRLPRDLPEGYTTEVGLAALEWMGELARAPFRGAVFIADYGFDAVELYAPERTTGTLRRYFEHRTDDRVLEDLGACDLTTHINFTRLKEEAEAGGLRLRTYEHQGRFLGKLGLPWLSTLEGRPPAPATQALLRQYQSLTHPAFMGRSFRVMVLEKG
jgi:SAM-dependent MidA family methyltransferase